MVLVRVVVFLSLAILISGNKHSKHSSSSAGDSSRKITETNDDDSTLQHTNDNDDDSDLDIFKDDPFFKDPKFSSLPISSQNITIQLPALPNFNLSTSSLDSFFNSININNVSDTFLQPAKLFVIFNHLTYFSDNFKQLFKW